jgi:predicted secreted protein
MAVQDGQLNGTELGVYIGGTLIAYSTSATLNMNHSTRSTSSKESGGWEDNMEGMRNWDVSCDALYAWLDPAGSAISNSTLSDMFTAYIATRASFTLTFGSTSTTGIGFTKYTGDAWMTSASISAPLEDTATFSVSFQGSGALTQTIDTTP